MGFVEFRACEIDGGCAVREQEIKDFADRLTSQFAPIALAGIECQIDAECQEANTELSAKDSATKYIDGNAVSSCPRIAKIQFGVLEAQNA